MQGLINVHVFGMLRYFPVPTAPIPLSESNMFWKKFLQENFLLFAK